MNGAIFVNSFGEVIFAISSRNSAILANNSCMGALVCTYREMFLGFGRFRFFFFFFFFELQINTPPKVLYSVYCPFFSFECSFDVTLEFRLPEQSAHLTLFLIRWLARNTMRAVHETKRHFNTVAYQRICTPEASKISWLVSLEVS